MYATRRINIPIALTLIRLIIAPLLLPLLVFYLFPSKSIYTHITLALLCAIFCLTDFLDGYLARRYGQVTALGKLLDPIADKFFISATLIALVAVQKLYFLWAILLIGREFLMNGLRAFSAQQQRTIPVSYLGKLKTTFQGILLFVIILNPYQWLGTYSSLAWATLESSLLAITLFLSFYSAYKYYQGSTARG